MSKTVLHLGKRNRERLIVAQEQLKSALKLVDSVLAGEPHWPSSNIGNAIGHAEVVVDYLTRIRENKNEGLTEKQKRENPYHL
jgi:hypothetical protein